MSTVQRGGAGDGESLQGSCFLRTLCPQPVPAMAQPGFSKSQGAVPVRPAGEVVWWARPRNRDQESRGWSPVLHQALCGLRLVTHPPWPASLTIKWKEWTQMTPKSFLAFTSQDLLVGPALPIARMMTSVSLPAGNAETGSDHWELSALPATSNPMPNTRSQPSFQPHLPGHSRWVWSKAKWRVSALQDWGLLLPANAWRNIF